MFLASLAKGFLKTKNNNSHVKPLPGLLKQSSICALLRMAEGLYVLQEPAYFIEGEDVVFGAIV